MSELEFLVHKFNDELSFEDDLFKGKPFVSEEHPFYPITFELALRRQSNVEKIQITSHHSFIPKSVELTALNDLSKKHLGEVVFKQKKGTTSKLELKTVYLDETMTSLLISITGNHKDDFENEEEKVGLVSIKLFGSTIPGTEESELFNRKPAVQKTIESDDKYTKELGDLHELLKKNKNKFVMDQNFAMAKQAQLSERILIKGSKEMSELERDMNEAVEDEDYQRAQELQDEMKNLRANLLAAIPSYLIEDVPNDPAPAEIVEVHRPKNLFAQDEDMNTPRPPRLFTPVDLSPTTVDTPLDVDFVVPPTRASSSRIKRSKTVVNRPASTDSIRSTASSRRRSESSASARPASVNSIKEEPQKDTKPPHPPVLKSALHPKLRAANRFMEKENMVVPALRGKPATSTGSPGSRDSSRDRRSSLQEPAGEDEFLSSIPAGERAPAARAIAHYGLETVHKLYSKKWDERNQVAGSVESAMRKIRSKEAVDYLDSGTFVLLKLLKDSLYNVYTTGLHLFTYITTDFIAKHQQQRQLNRLATETNGILTMRCNDNQNDRRSPQETIKTMKTVLQSDTKISKVFLHKFLSADALNGKLEKGRAQLIQDAAKFYKVPNKEVGLPEDEVRKYAMLCVNNSESDVRNIGKDLLLQIYEYGDRDKTRNLLTNGNMKKNPFIRGITDDMERIDRNNKPSKAWKEVRIQTAPSTVESTVDRDSCSTTLSFKRESSQNLTNYSNLLSQSNLRIIPERIDPKKFKLLLCVFCGESRSDFTESGLDRHYLQECAMLKKCDHCNEIIEISQSDNHLLKDCRASDVFRKCPRCELAIDRKNYPLHLTKSNCKKPMRGTSICKLCETVVKPSTDAAWRKHLMGECSKNTRYRTQKKKRTAEAHF